MATRERTLILDKAACLTWTVVSTNEIPDCFLFCELGNSQVERSFNTNYKD